MQKETALKSIENLVEQGRIKKEKLKIVSEWRKCKKIKRFVLNCITLKQNDQKAYFYTLVNL